MPIETYSFTVHVGNKPQVITNKELEEYAKMVGLQAIASERYSWLFAIDLLLFERVNGIDPHMIVDEIKTLEGVRPGGGTKLATQFERKPLKGLWHKHFFSAHFVAYNIVNEIAGKKLKCLVDEIFDSNKSLVVTREMSNVLAHRACVGPLENRDGDGRLTGEWIVFAKHDGNNYYLCLSTHKTGDQQIYDRIKSVCYPQFPFLA